MSLKAEKKPKVDFRHRIVISFEYLVRIALLVSGIVRWENVAIEAPEDDCRLDGLLGQEGVGIPVAVADDVHDGHVDEVDDQVPDDVFHLHLLVLALAQSLVENRLQISFPCFRPFRTGG